MKNRIGIMQGRLSPRPAGKLQAFPHDSWQREFSAAARLGFDAIEWIFELDHHTENPLWTAEGRSRIRRSARASGVLVHSICADYFMLHQLAGGGASRVAESVAVLKQVIGFAHEIGAERILLPLLETAAVDTPELRAEIVDSLKRAAETAEAYGVVLGLEMEIPGPEYRALIDRVGHPLVRAYYDSGNSTAQGHDIGTDVVPLLPVLHAVHLKDRRRFGTSVRLGSGDANFDGFFRALHGAAFQGDLVLQHYFDDDPREAAREALAFVRQRLLRATEAA